jgi:site-specific DNA recombinase
MTIRTGKGGRYRYYTCSIKARQGETGCEGRSIPMDKLDGVVIDHIEREFLDPPGWKSCCPLFSIAGRNAASAAASISPNRTSAAQRRSYA